MGKKDEYLDKYVKEEMPRKPYKVKPKYNLRKRRKNELFWDEILIALFIVAMLVMIFINYQNQLNYQAEEQEETREVDVGVGIEETNLEAPVYTLLTSSNIHNI